MPRFVSIGECMVELAPAGDRNLYALGFAGDTFNTAWYARRLLPAGWEVDYVTAVGNDVVSDRMLAFLREAGIGTRHVARDAERTVGLYMIELTPEGERSFAYWRSDSAARRLCADPALVTHALDGANVAYFSGITLAILPIEAQRTLLRLLDGARAAGLKVVFDPNLRPQLWADMQSMRETIMAAACVSDVVLPSYEDEAEHFEDADIEATARRYAEAGAQCVIVKNGPHEMRALVGGESSRHPSLPADRVIDTTAAGDSFNAGFAAAWFNGADLASAVAAGSRTATRVIGARGALVPI